MVDRLMRPMDKHLFCSQYFHGSLEAAELSIRAWVIIQNFAPSNPYTIKKFLIITDFGEGLKMGHLTRFCEFKIPI